MRKKHGVDTDIGGAEIAGGVVGGALGYFLGGGTPQQRIMRGMMGAGLGGVTASGVHSLATPLDFSDLTPEELEAIEAEARRLEKKRPSFRAMTLGGGALSSVALGSPLPMALSAPVAIMGPAAGESAALKRMAHALRTSRRRRDG